MKLIASVLIFVIVLLGVAWNINRRVIEQHDTTHLMWSEERAYLFVSRRNMGWSGNLIQLAWEFARGAVGLSGHITDQTWWLEVYELTADRVVRTVVPTTGSTSPAVSGGRIYATYRGELSEWNDGSFRAVAPDQIASIRQSMHGGEFTKVEGWSSLYNIDNRAEGQRTYPIAFRGVTVDIIVNQQIDRRTLSAKFPDKPAEAIVDLPTGAVWVDASTYATLLEPPLAR